MSESNQIPLSVDELTTDWLQEIMQPHIGSSTITGFEPTVIGVGEGFMGQLARVKLSYDNETDAPTSIIAKFASPLAETRQMAEDQRLYHRELGFYRDLGASVGVPVPDCYFLHHQEDTYQFVLILEDMSPGVASDQVEGTDKETSRRVIEETAKLHAKWWNSEKLDDYPWAKWLMKEMSMEEGAERLKEGIRQAEETGKFDAYPEMKRLMPLLVPLMKFDPAPPYPFTMTHGDLRSDNIIRPSEEGGRLAILDWQLSGLGDPVQDIARWMTQSITIEDRRATEQDLLKLYHSKLLEYGVKGYSYRSFINNYKTNLIVILLMFSMPMDSVDQSSDRAKALFHEFYSRLDAALVDWEIEKPLKALPYIYPFIKITLLIKAAFGRKSS